jgi:hypothetical protein
LARGFLGWGSEKGKGFKMSDDSAINPAAKVYGWELRLDMAARGVKNAFPPTATDITLHGVPYTQPALLARAQEEVAPWKAVREAKAVIRAFAQQKKALIERARKFLGELQVGITAHVGLENEILTEYGFKPKKRKKPLPVEKNAIRVAKAKLTRLRRGTKGKRQKEALKFTGPLQVVVSPDGASQVIDMSAPPVVVAPPISQPLPSPPTPPTPPPTAPAEASMEVSASAAVAEPGPTAAEGTTYPAGSAASKSAAEGTTYPARSAVAPTPPEPPAAPPDRGSP